MERTAITGCLPNRTRPSMVKFDRTGALVLYARSFGRLSPSTYDVPTISSLGRYRIA